MDAYCDIRQWHKLTISSRLHCAGACIILIWVRMMVGGSEVIAGAPRRRMAPPLVSTDPNSISAPADDEVYEYLGPQMRWMQLALLIAFIFVAASLAAFATARPVLLPVLAVLVLNVIGTVLSVITGSSRRRVSWRSHQELTASWMPAGERFGSVDVFLPTCGEDLRILRNTYQHVAELSWPGQLAVYVLDDAGRDEVAALADEFGFAYVRRSSRGHLRKAGNLRHAFAGSSGEVIVIFDADFCPRRDFLAHLMPYLDDPQVAIVQSPQCFATTEAMGWIQRTAGATQEFFYRWVQPSRDALGAANCVGTSALYRRSALEQIGGFAPIEHSEDLHTGMHLQQAGYRITYVPVVLSRGLCPSDLAGFLNQQYRWCMGSLSRVPNTVMTEPLQPMTLRQRLAHLAGVFYYLTTAFNVFLVFLPGIIMVGVYPEDVRPWQLVPFLFGLWVYVVLFALVSRARWRVEVLRVQMAYSFAHVVAIWHKVTGREIGWVPTGAIGASNSLARSISVLGAFSLGASLLAFWVLLVNDVVVRGLADFWLMAGFVCAYTYLVSPLLIEFVRVLTRRNAERADDLGSATAPADDAVSSDDPAPASMASSVATAPIVARYTQSVSADEWVRPLRTDRRPVGPNWNRITGWEVVGYTLVIIFIAALAVLPTDVVNG